jgi:O-antigen/teichoic acid export membrane protein
VPQFRFDKKFVKNTALSAASALGMQGILALIIYPYLSKTLGSGRFGFFMLALSFTNFVVPVFAGAFANSLMRQHRDLPEDQKGGFWLTGAVTITLVGSLLAGALVALAGPLASRWKIPELAAWLPALAPSMVGTMVYYNLRLQLIARVAFNRMVLNDVVYGLGLLAVPLGCSLGFLGDRWPLLFAVAPAMAIASISIYLVGNNALSLKGAGPAMAKRILGPMSIYLFGLAAAWVMRMGDRWILGESGLPGEQIAYYTVAIQASFLVLFPLEHVSVVLMSLFSNVKTLDEIEPAHLRRYFLALAASMGILALAGPLLGYAYIRLLFGPEYVAVGMPVYLISLGALVIYLFQMFGRGIIVRFRHPVTDPVVSTLFAVISMTLIWVLVSGVGVIGAAFGRGIGFAGVGIAFAFICQRPLLRQLISRKGAGDAVSPVPPGGSGLDQCSDRGVVRSG